MDWICVTDCCQHCTESYNVLRAEEYIDQGAAVGLSRTLLLIVSYCVYYVIAIA